MSPVGIVVVEPSGSISLANDRAESLLGLENDQITSRRYTEPEWQITYEDGTPVPDSEHPVTRVLESGDPVFGFEHWIELPDGTKRWLSSNCAPILNDDGTVKRVVVGLEDATRLKKREEQLEWLVGTEVLADIGGWELDLETDRIEGTAGMQRLHDGDYDLSLEDALALYHPDDRPDLRSAIETCRETGDPIKLEARRQTSDETERWFRIRAEKVVIDGAAKLRGVVRDISQDKEREQRIMVMSRVLRHNIRNKLTVIRGNAQLLKSELDALDSAIPPDQHREESSAAVTESRAEPASLRDVSEAGAKQHADRIEYAAKELNSLAERARKFDRITERDLRGGTVHLQQALAQIQADITDRFPDASVELSAAATEISGDRMALDLLVEILVGNAIERSDRPTPDIRLGAEVVDSEQVTISVHDDGPRLSETETKALTAETERPTAHSRGLGLWIVTWLTRRLGGSVALAETGDTGTRIELTVPLAGHE